MWMLNNAWYLFMIEAVVILVMWDITGTRKDDDEEDDNEADRVQGMED